MTTEGGTPSFFVSVPSRARRTVVPAIDLGLSRAEFAMVVESDAFIVADRTMTWDATGYGGHTETGVPAPATTWYFAEGATHSGFDLFYLLANPNELPVVVDVRYIRPAPAPALVRSYEVGARSRRTIWVNIEHPALASTDVAAVVETREGGTIVAERAMYRTRAGEVFAAGHGSAGIRTPASRWWFAEGATGSFFDTFVLVANPGAREADLTVTYFLPTGERITKPHTVPAGSRHTIWVDQEDSRVASSALGIEVASSNEVPVVVERAMWWPGSVATWAEAHASPGLTSPAARWATADVEVGGSSDATTFLLIANIGSQAGLVRVTVPCEGAPTVVARLFSIAATSRLDVEIGREFPESRGRRCSALVESASPAPLALIVERASYWDAAGRFWAAGTAAAATAVP
jgi:hypothetical protein